MEKTEGLEARSLLHGAVLFPVASAWAFDAIEGLSNASAI
jgi:hypothetical protein